MTTAQLRTSGDIARELGSKVSRVRYILDTREHIRPIARAGIVRLYDETTVELVKRELETRATPNAQPAK